MYTNTTKLYLLLLAASILLLNGCAKEYINTSEICFDQQVLPIFQSNCAYSGCHNSTDRRNGYDLSSYTEIVKKGIEPGNYKKSKIYEVLIKTIGEEAMPPAPYNQLSSSQIATIALWIEQGAKNTSCTTTCDTTTATYTAKIKPILDTYCIGCHAGATASGGIDYEQFAILQYTALDGSLLGSIKHTTGYQPMPKDANQLSDCNIALFEKWIREGALEN